MTCDQVSIIFFCH